jgi:glycosyltransferase involved in cell wall biosynthesis
MARQQGIPILFALHNFSYANAAAFRMVDRVVVPTEFARRYYREKLGLACDLLPLVIDPERANVSGTLRVPSVSGTRSVPDTAQCVTFVNPEPRKGVHVFTRIAEVLSRRRPEIPLLLVEGASKASFLPQLGIDLSGLKNLRIVPNSPDARQFLAATKILLMPSLMENAGLVAMEAMLNGIPVLASNRGALPETIGDAGFLFDIPARYTPDTRELPTAAEVEPWVETIIRLWDDAAEYDRWSRAARERAERWHPDRLAPIYREFFSQITHQPGPPLVPKEVAE